MWNLSIYIVCIYFLAFVRSDCQVKYPDERKLMPSYTRTSAGGLKIPYNWEYFEITENELITVFCLSKINTFYDGYEWNDYYKRYYGKHKIENLRETTLVCRDGHIKWAQDEHNVTTETLSCEPMKWSLYFVPQSDICGPQEIFYGLGTSLGEKILWLARLCYNFKEYAIGNLTYYIGPDTFKDDHNERPVLEPQEEMTKDLPSLQTNVFHMSHINDKFLQLAIDRKVFENPWLNLAHYNYHSLVQGKLYMEYFKEYNRFLEVPWWKNLRLGNWQRITHALEQQATRTTYRITTGTSGVVGVPYDDGCRKTKHLHLMVQGVNVTVPAYIWSYIQPLDNTTDGFVVIGHNSPYFEFFPHEDLLFCKDICDTIDWMKEIRYSLKYANAGIVFCCSPNEIWEKKLLQGFPVAPPTKQPVTTVQQTPDEIAENESTTENYRMNENEIDD